MLILILSLILIPILILILILSLILILDTDSASDSDSDTVGIRGEVLKLCNCRQNLAESGGEVLKVCNCRQNLEGRDLDGSRGGTGRTPICGLLCATSLTS